MGRGMELASQLVKSLALLAQMRQTGLYGSGPVGKQLEGGIKKHFWATAGKLLRDSYIYIIHGIQGL